MMLWGFFRASNSSFQPEPNSIRRNWDWIACKLFFSLSDWASKAEFKTEDLAEALQQREGALPHPSLPFLCKRFPFFLMRALPPYLFISLKSLLSCAWNRRSALSSFCKTLATYDTTRIFRMRFPGRRRTQTSHIHVDNRPAKKTGWKSRNLESYIGTSQTYTECCSLNKKVDSAAKSPPFQYLLHAEPHICFFRMCVCPRRHVQYPSFREHTFQYAKRQEEEHEILSRMD